MNTAEQLEQNEKYDEAYAEYKKQLAQKPSDIDILTKLAHLALILEKKEDASKSVLIECESYLGYYYFLKKDYEQSKVFWNKILQIDPENPTAKQAVQGL